MDMFYLIVCLTILTFALSKIAGQELMIDEYTSYDDYIRKEGGDA